MTIDERAQLVEDIRVAGAKRRDIAERAQLDKEFDIDAAWEELTDLDASIENRIGDILRHVRKRHEKRTSRSRDELVGQ